MDQVSRILLTWNSNIWVSNGHIYNADLMDCGLCGCQSAVRGLGFQIGQNLNCGPYVHSSEGLCFGFSIKQNLNCEVKVHQYKYLPFWISNIAKFIPWTSHLRKLRI